MINFLVRRLIYMVITLVLASLIGFFLIELPPGDIVDVKISQLRRVSGTVSQDQIADLERRYGVNDPLHVKYWKWLSRTV